VTPAGKRASAGDGRIKALGQRLLPWLLPLLALAAWEGLTRAGLMSSRLLPRASDVAVATVRLTVSGELPTHLRASFLRAAAGFAVGGSIGFVLGLFNAMSTIAEQLLDSTVQMIRNIPHLAMIPLVILWFGIDEEAKLFLVALGVMFPIYVNTFHGIRTVDNGLVEMARSYGLSSWQLFWQVILPGALPSILVGLRFALGLMWLTLIVAETISAPSGIGYMAMNAREFLQIDVVMLAVLLYALLGKAADSAARLLERLTLQWHPAYGKG
jgi:sulfonate transport system permease protein